MFEDIFSSAGGMIGGMSWTILGILSVLVVPLIIFWCLITLYGLYLLFMRKFAIIMPWGWNWNVVVAKPYADESIGFWEDNGALCKIMGLTRFKLKKENFLMQKMDTKDIYRGNEIFIISLGPSKKFYSTIKLDHKNNTVILEVENPQVAQMHYLDHLAMENPDYLSANLGTITILFMYWTIVTMLTSVSGFMVFYPVFLSLMGAKFGF